MAAKANKNSILTAYQLSVELGIKEAEALELMKRDDFPATCLGGNNYVVDRSLLEAWVQHNARRVDGVNTGLLAAFPEF